MVKGAGLNLTCLDAGAAHDAVVGVCCDRVGHSDDARRANRCAFSAESAFFAVCFWRYSTNLHTIFVGHIAVDLWVVKSVALNFVCNLFPELYGKFQILGVGSASGNGLRRCEGRGRGSFCGLKTLHKAVDKGFGSGGEFAISSVNQVDMAIDIQPSDFDDVHLSPFALLFYRQLGQEGDAGTVQYGLLNRFVAAETHGDVQVFGGKACFGKLFPQGPIRS